MTKDQLELLFGYIDARIVEYLADAAGRGDVADAIVVREWKDELLASTKE